MKYLLVLVIFLYADARQCPGNGYCQAGLSCFQECKRYTYGPGAGVA